MSGGARKIVDVKNALAGAIPLNENNLLTHKNALHMAALTSGIAAGIPTGLPLINRTDTR